jgi:hypothetical protein
VIAAFGVLPPLFSVFTYRRAGVRWSRAVALGALAVILAAVGGVVFGIAYGFGVSIETGLCGQLPSEAIAAGVGAYLVVGSWAALRPSRVWAWSFAIGAGIALVLLVSYFFGDAHHYCET